MGYKSMRMRLWQLGGCEGGWRWGAAPKRGSAPLVLQQRGAQRGQKEEGTRRGFMSCHGPTGRAGSGAGVLCLQRDAWVVRHSSALPGTAPRQPKYVRDADNRSFREGG